MKAMKLTSVSRFVLVLHFWLVVEPVRGTQSTTEVLYLRTVIIYLQFVEAERSSPSVLLNRNVVNESQEYNYP